MKPCEKAYLDELNSIQKDLKDSGKQDHETAHIRLTVASYILDFHRQLEMIGKISGEASGAEFMLTNKKGNNNVN